MEVRRALVETASKEELPIKMSMGESSRAHWLLRGEGGREREREREGERERGRDENSSTATTRRNMK